MQASKRASKSALSVVLLGCALAACTKDETKPTPAASASAATAVSSSASSAAVKPVGIHAPDNDPKLVLLAKKVVSDCKWDTKKGYDECEPLKAYRAFKPEASDKTAATLVNFIEDEDEKVRGLSTVGLLSFGTATKYQESKELGERLVAALEKEKNAAFDGRLARQVSKIDPDKVPLGDRIKAIALKPDTAPDVAAFIAAWWGYDTTPENQPAYEVAKTLAETAKNPRVKRSALMGLKTFVEKHPDDVCRIWFEQTKDSDVETAQAAMGAIAGAPWINTHDQDSSGSDSAPARGDLYKCKQITDVLKVVEAESAKGPLKSRLITDVLAYEARAKVDSADKKKAVALLKKVAGDKKQSTYEREGALDALVASDAANKAFVATFAADPELQGKVKALTAK